MTKEWYFQEGDERIGPVTAATLKKLAGSGRIRPETLIWKHGMAGWAPAQSVKGLISAEATTAGRPPPEPPRTPVAGDRNPPSDDWHPLDNLVSAIRHACPPDLPADISRVAGTAGLYVTYAAALVTLALGVVIDIHTKQIAMVWLNLFCACAMIGVQYATSKLLAAGARTIQLNPSTLASAAIPDCTAVLTFLGTFGAFAGLMWAGINTGLFRFEFAAMLVLTVGTFVAIAALHPTGITVTQKKDCLASEDALGILTFFVKLMLRSCPVVFCVAVVAGTFEMGRLAINIIRSDVSAFDPEIDGFEAGFLIGLLINAVAIPIYVYFSAVLYYLTLDTVSAILSLPAKVDAISAMGDKPGDGRA